MGAVAPILRAFLFPLVATLAVEAIAAALLGLRSLREQGVVAAMNTMTNPLLVFSLLLFARAGVRGNVALAVLECAVVFAEWRVLHWAVGDRVRHPLAVSFALNAASFVVGIVLGVVVRAAL